MPQRADILGTPRTLLMLKLRYDLGALHRDWHLRGLAWGFKFGPADRSRAETSSRPHPATTASLQAIPQRPPLEIMRSLRAIASTFRPKTGMQWAMGTVSTAVVVALGSTAAIAHWKKVDVAQRYGVLQGNANAVEVFSKSGARIGIRRLSGNAPGSIVVLPSRDVPADFMAMLTALEDGNRNLPVVHWYGIDLQRLGRDTLCHYVWRKFDPGIVCGGASSLEMSAARGWHGRFGGMAGRSEDQKIAEITDALSLSVLVAEDKRKGDALLVDGLTFGTAPGGYELYGPRIASKMLFGAEPEKLNLAQLAVIAALPKRHKLHWSCEPVVQFSKDDAEDREAIKDRARLAIKTAFAAADPRALAAVAELETMTLPTRPAAIDVGMTLGLDPRAACLAAANPLQQVGRLVPAENTMMTAELRAIEIQFGRVEAIQLTTDPGVSQVLAQQSNNALAVIQRAQPTFAEHLVGNGNKADILAAATDSGGAVTGLYSSSELDLVHMPIQLGSVGKLPTALTAAKLGYLAEQPLCWTKDTVTHIQDAGGFEGFGDCSTERSKLSVSASFGRSKNLPVLWLARRLPVADLSKALADAGFSIPVGVDPAFGSVAGLAMATPAQSMAVTMAIANGLAGKPATAVQPYVIARVRVNGKWLEPHRQRVDLSSYFSSPQARAFIAAALTGTFQDGEGTLRGALSSAADPLEVGKSGTVAGPKPELNTRIKLAVSANADRSGWMTVIHAKSGYIGGAGFSSILLSRSTRDFAKANDRGPMRMGDRR